MSTDGVRNAPDIGKVIQNIFEKIFPKKEEEHKCDTCNKLNPKQCIGYDITEMDNQRVKECTGYEKKVK